jgi:hypothetical protein
MNGKKVARRRRVSEEEGERLGQMIREIVSLGYPPHENYDSGFSWVMCSCTYFLNCL